MDFPLFLGCLLIFLQLSWEKRNCFHAQFLVQNFFLSYFPLNIECLDVDFLQISMKNVIECWKNIYIYDKFIALKDEKNGFPPIFGLSTYFSSIERGKKELFLCPIWVQNPIFSYFSLNIECLDVDFCKFLWRMW